MAKIIMTCGKICCGKSTYAEQLRSSHHSVILSVDEITMALFDQEIGDKLDGYVNKIKKYLFHKSLEFIEAGIDVILDWGFWTRSERNAAKEFYQSRHIEYEFHYLDIRDEVWKKRLKQRNHLVQIGEKDAYFVDDGLAEKFTSLFEIPEREEIDVWLSS